MIRKADFAYAQVRLQSHHGQRPGEPTWRLLSASKDLGHFLQTARRSPLKTWIVPLSGQMDFHALERSLRSEWRRYAGEVAAWQPPPWRPAVAWTGWLIDLPAIAHLLGKEPALAWMADDPSLAPFSLDEQSARASALQRASFAAALKTETAQQNLVGGWLSHWRNLWPPSPQALRKPLETLQGLLMYQMAQMAAPKNTAADAIRLRKQLESRLARIFRRETQSPAAAFAHLALTALDLERLRAGLVDRCFAGPVIGSRS